MFKVYLKIQILEVKKSPTNLNGEKCRKQENKREAKFKKVNTKKNTSNKTDLQLSKEKLDKNFQKKSQNI